MRSFYVHAAVYLAANTGLFVIDMLASPGGEWFFFPLVGWGMGLFFQGLSAFRPRRRLGRLGGAEDSSDPGR